VMPYDAPHAKVEATRAHGPQLVFYDRETEDREEIAARIAAGTGAVIVPPYDHAWIVAGQGTAAYELVEQEADLDALAVPLGGGGLLSGTLLAAKALRPGIKVYGVEPELANDWYISLERGERVKIDSHPTIADGLRTPMPGRIPFDIGRSLCDGVVLVSEAEIKNTLAYLLSRMKILAEPSGVVAAAAALHGKLPGGIRRLGVILSGGNIDMQMLAEICREAA
jgi:threonine dehydratase